MLRKGGCKPDQENQGVVNSFYVFYGSPNLVNVGLCRTVRHTGFLCQSKAWIVPVGANYFISYLMYQILSQQLFLQS